MLHDRLCDALLGDDTVNYTVSSVVSSFWRWVPAVWLFGATLAAEMAGFCPRGEGGVVLYSSQGHCDGNPLVAQPLALPSLSSPLRGASVFCRFPGWPHESLSSNRPHEMTFFMNSASLLFPLSRPQHLLMTSMSPLENCHPLGSAVITASASARISWPSP